MHRMSASRQLGAGNIFASCCFGGLESPSTSLPSSDQCAHDRLGVAPPPSDALSSSPSTLSSFAAPSSQGALGASVVVLVLLLQSCRNVVSMLLAVGSVRPSGIDHLAKSVCFNTTVLIVFSLFEIPCRQKLDIARDRCDLWWCWVVVGLPSSSQNVACPFPLSAVGMFVAALGGAAVFRLVFGATAQFRFDDFTIRATSLDAERSTLQVRVWDSEFRRKVFMRRKAPNV